ncbi:MAG: bacteriohemerythrin [Treponema sp.]|nr:bacteriohemerythrin [Treponema sp.]
MAYLWNSVLETGHEKIDKQHKQLFIALNDIAKAFKEGTGSQELFKTLGFLTDYTVMHFTTEEDLMEKYDYPGYKAHKQCHEDFKVTVAELTEQLYEKGPCEDLIVNVTAVIGDWLISHIRVDDIKMASFVNSKTAV